MTILSAAQSASIRLIGDKPSSLFAATDQFLIELADLATESAKDIAQAHDWRALTKLASLNGDGVATQLNLPGDYDRMPKAAVVHSSQFRHAMFRPAASLDDYFDYQQFSYGGLPGTWIVLAGKIQIYPAIPAGQTASFYYISNAIVYGASTAQFTTDGDAFVLSERLLTLAMIWRWRAQKRLEYAEDMANFEKALAEEIAKDKGARVLREGRARYPGHLSSPYPGTLGP